MMAFIYIPVASFLFLFQLLSDNSNGGFCFYRRLSLFIFGICFVAADISAQSGFEISAKIIDQQTGSALPDAYVVYHQRAKGIMANENGYILITGEESRAAEDIIYVSHLGYKTKIIPWREAARLKVIELTPTQYLLPDIMITERKRKVNWKQIYRQAVKEYDSRRRKDPALALGHYVEEARLDGIPIMYMESTGFIVNMGVRENVALYSNMKFFCDQTKAYVTHPSWLEYSKYGPEMESGDPVLPGSSSNLNFLRVQQEEGILAPSQSRKFNCTLDSSFIFHQNPVYVLKINGKKTDGTIHILEIDDDYLITEFHVQSDGYWSTARHKRMPAKVSVKLQYIDRTPFVKSVTAIQDSEGLEYRNELISLIQKLDHFTLSDDEYWSLNDYAVNPFISFDSSLYMNNAADHFNQAYAHMAVELKRNDIHLEEEMNKNSDKWFLSQPGNIKATKLIEDLRKSIFE